LNIEDKTKIFLKKMRKLLKELKM